MIASPDVVNADGVSRSVVEMILRDQNGAPIAGQAVEFGFNGDGGLAPSPDSTFVGPLQSSLIMATDSQGVARVIYVAGTTVGATITDLRAALRNRCQSSVLPNHRDLPAVNG